MSLASKSLRVYPQMQLQRIKFALVFVPII